MRAILVCVDYADVLTLTLPYNRHHFEEVLVVTTPKDYDTIDVCKANEAGWHTTYKFYESGADFNKWAALEEALDYYDREGWLCIMDADVFWPTDAPLDLKKGCLYTPKRHMCPKIQSVPEHEWARYPIHRNLAEWAGYSQIFHASDPVLPEPPWHEVNWRHAGGADSFFQRLWPKERKVRPDWNVLHVGPSGRNWCGKDPQSQHKLREYLTTRRRTRSYAHEKVD